MDKDGGLEKKGDIKEEQMRRTEIIIYGDWIQDMGIGSAIEERLDLLAKN